MCTRHDKIGSWIRSKWKRYSFASSSFFFSIFILLFRLFEMLNAKPAKRRYEEWAKLLRKWEQICQSKIIGAKVFSGKRSVAIFCALFMRLSFALSVLFTPVQRVPFRRRWKGKWHTNASSREWRTQCAQRLMLQRRMHKVAFCHSQSVVNLNMNIDSRTEQKRNYFI